MRAPVRLAATAPLPLVFEPLPPLAQALPVGIDENHWERVIRVDGFGPVDMIVDRLAVAPIDRVLFDDRFVVLDTNRDAYLAYDEWTGPRPLFYDLDRDGDRFLTPVELRVADPRLEQVRLVDRERYVAFHLLDVDDDGVIAPWEWTGDMDLFFAVDASNDGVVSQEEYLGLVRTRPVSVRYAWNGDLDLDRDGYVERVEWVGDPYRFASLDMDRDGRVEKWEALTGWLMRV